MKDLGGFRKSYEKSELLETNLSINPMVLFEKWFEETENSDTIDEVNAMTLSTFGRDGFPKSRVVLLKEFNENGFVFYTNYESEKGKAILDNPNVCLSFFWQSQERQVIIKGQASKTAAAVSDKYFLSRPVSSQLGAIVSDQSAVIADRNYLEEKFKRVAAAYANSPIERPDNWGGFVVKPVEFEFWQGRPNRLHDRIRYKLMNDLLWIKERLSP
jgi:pyridoxamine 5'-phosphate oxidase